ncbi:MAG: hypothetical protein LBS89_00345 [Zoogloeaceae bacterium]|jgi:hypothetical protein|nr:hypothetical protein [Zoogloeaceae bacterium]
MEIDLQKRYDVVLVDFQTARLMLGALPYQNEVNHMRHLKDNEQALLTKLIAEAPQATYLFDSLSRVLAEEMNDGGMDSLRFFASDDAHRCFEKQLLERQFIDANEISVPVVVNLDDQGDLFELDIWKVDFSPLKQFPSV